MKNKKHKKNWFVNRMQREVAIRRVGELNSFTIKDEQHANYLYLNQDEQDCRYEEYIVRNWVSSDRRAC